jgi:hypothetical protein
MRARRDEQRIAQMPPLLTCSKRGEPIAHYAHTSHTFRFQCVIWLIEHRANALSLEEQLSNQDRALAEIPNCPRLLIDIRREPRWVRRLAASHELLDAGPSAGRLQPYKDG